MKRDGVENWLDEPAVVAQAHDLIRAHPKVDVLFRPDLLEHLNGERL